MEPKRSAQLMFLLYLLPAALMACVPAANTADAGVNPAGFWAGFWHGLIIFFTFLISLFNGRVGIYEIHNNGVWYNLGFLIGIMAWGGGGVAAHKKRRRVNFDAR